MPGRWWPPHHLAVGQLREELVDGFVEAHHARLHQLQRRHRDHPQDREVHADDGCERDQQDALHHRDAASAVLRRRMLLDRGAQVGEVADRSHTVDVAV